MRIVATVATLLFLTAGTARAQYLSVAPTTHVAWGKTPSVTTFSFTYKDFGIHYFAPYDEGFDRYNNKVRQGFGLSYRPINIKDIFKAGIIVFDRKYPTSSGRRANIWLQAGIDIWRMRVSYNHISNAYTGELNTGLDFISLSFKLWEEE